MFDNSFNEYDLVDATKPKACSVALVYILFEESFHAQLDRMHKSILLKNNVKPVTFSDHCLVPLEFRDSRHEKSRFNWGLRKLNLTLSEDDKPQDLITMYFKKNNEQGVATFERCKSFEGNVKFIAINRSSELLY